MENIEKINFEDKILKAKEILEKLTNPNVTLSDSLQLYSDGVKQLQEAQKLLEEAKLIFSTQNRD